MSKIRMNTEYRNKLFNRIKDVFENKNLREINNRILSLLELDVNSLRIHHKWWVFLPKLIRVPSFACFY